jgi:type VI secretion system protein ImpB
MPESTQKKLSRVRPPRVQITYDVEIGDAIQMKELPFVAGILADLSGQPAEALPPLKDRKFVEIDRDNFNDVLKAAAPRLAVRVPNRLAKDDSMLPVELKFTSMDDFDPVRVDEMGKLHGLIPQVESLAKLFEARTRLVDLLAKLDGNDKLDALLQDVINNPESQKALKSGSTPPAT